MIFLLGIFLSLIRDSLQLFELQQRAHSPQLAAGLASESKN